MSATSILTKAKIQNGVQGGWIEIIKCSIDPASVAANAQGIETIALTGAKVGDLVFVNVEASPTSLVPVGAKVTATNVISVYFNNTIDATTAVDAGALVVNVLILHLS